MVERRPALTLITHLLLLLPLSFFYLFNEAGLVVMTTF